MSKLCFDPKFKVNSPKKVLGGHAKRGSGADFSTTWLFTESNDLSTGCLVWDDSTLTHQLKLARLSIRKGVLRAENEACCGY